MTEYEKLFTMTLHERLKGIIRGGIHIVVTPDDVLRIKIACDNFIFIAKFGDFSNKIRSGWTTEYAAYEVEKLFRSYIKNRYFV